MFDKFNQMNSAEEDDDGFEVIDKVEIEKVMNKEVMKIKINNIIV